jgi:hypothetical protein
MDALQDAFTQLNQRIGSQFEAQLIRYFEPEAKVASHNQRLDKLISSIDMHYNIILGFPCSSVPSRMTLIFNWFSEGKPYGRNRTSTNS